jgi:hypothetical protein
MTIGLLLLSRLGPHTSGLITSLYIFVFGMGLGSVMQVLVIAVQNAVDYQDLGAATSGVTYFRSITSSISAPECACATLSLSSGANGSSGSNRCSITTAARSAAT